MPEITKSELERLQRASKFLLDNPEFNMVYEYCEDTLVEALVEGSDDDAVSNLKNVRAVKMIKQLMENLVNG